MTADGQEEMRFVRVFGTLLQEYIHHTDKRVLNVKYIPGFVLRAGRVNWKW